MLANSSMPSIIIHVINKIPRNDFFFQIQFDAHNRHIMGVLTVLGDAGGKMGSGTLCVAVWCWSRSSGKQ